VKCFPCFFRYTEKNMNAESFEQIVIPRNLSTFETYRVRNLLIVFSRLRK